MKANDLMIGDWYYWEAEGKKYPLQVTKETFKLSDEDVSNFQPIPLTKEILKKNGYTRNKDNSYILDRVGESHYYYYQGSVGIDIGAYESPLFADCNFVHELQHLLKLCKIDKEIVV